MRSLLILIVTAAAACSSSNDPSGAGGSEPTSTVTSSSPASSSSETSTGSGGGGQGGQSGQGGSGGGGGASGDTYSNYAMAFVATYCIECHGAGKTHDFTTYAGIKAAAPLIRCGVAPILESGCSGSPAPKQFPIDDAMGTNPKPTDADRARMVAWIDAGLPQ